MKAAPKSASPASRPKPRACPEENLFLELLRTTDMLSRHMTQVLKAEDLTSNQYNVLRILRGAQPQGLPCSAIGDRMIAAEPDITRLLARLKRLKLIRQHRDRRDRRVVLTEITESGLELLEAMDPAVRSAPRELLGHIQGSDLAELIRLLELARHPCADKPQPR